MEPIRLAHRSMTPSRNASPIALECVDFDQLRARADLFQGQPGLDAEITLLADGRVRIEQFTAPRFAMVEREFEESLVTGSEEQTVIDVERVQVGMRVQERTRRVVCGYSSEKYTVAGPVYEDREVERTREVPRYATETYTEAVPVFEERKVEVTREVPVYGTHTVTREVEELIPPRHVDTTFIDLNEGGGTVFIDGRITKLSGDLRGRLTIVGNEKVRVTGNVRYVDGNGDTAMLNGRDCTQPYERNPDYDGNSKLDVIARGDLLLTRGLPQRAEINATLASLEGRVGIDGFRIPEEGEPDKAYLSGLSSEARAREEAYNLTPYKTRRFRRESLRRVGALHSHGRVLETYIRARKDGTSAVDSGFESVVRRP